MVVLEHCSNCEGSHPAPLDEACPFPASEQPITRMVTRWTRRTPSLSPPPPPKRGRGGRQCRGRGGKTAHQHDQSPAAPDAAQNQPDPPQSPDRPTSRDPGIQPLVVLQPADCQAAAIQAIIDQIARMQQDTKAFQKQLPGTGKLTGRRCCDGPLPPSQLQAPVARSLLNPGFRTHQLTSGPRPGSLLLTLPRATAHHPPCQPPTPRGPQCPLQSSPPDRPAQTSFQTGKKSSQTFVHRNSLSPRSPSARSSSGELAWTPSFCSK